MQQSASYLLFPHEYSLYNQMLILNERFETFESLPQRELVSLKNHQLETSEVVYVYNPTDQRRIEIMRLHLDTHQVRVMNHQQSNVPCQVDPIWSDKRSNIIDSKHFQVN